MNLYEYDQAIRNIENTCGLSDSRMADAHINASDTMLEKYDTDNECELSSDALNMYVSVFRGTISEYAEHVNTLSAVAACPDCGASASDDQRGHVCHTCRRGIIA